MSRLIRKYLRSNSIGISLTALLLVGAVQAAVSTGPMSLPRMFDQSAILADGRVLVTGGSAQAGVSPHSSAEIYNPATDSFTPVSPMLQGRKMHAAATLRDGRVLVVGGIVAGGNDLGVASAEIFDPATGLWSPTGNMNAVRPKPMALLLPDGRVFVISSDSFNAPAYAEIFDPQTGAFTKTGNQLEITQDFGLVVLQDGRILKMGGEKSSNVTNSASIWSPATNQWTATGRMREVRKYFKPVLLPNGRVLVAGGQDYASGISSVEIYDPAQGTFNSAGNMPAAVNFVNLAQELPGGDIVLSGESYNSLLRYNTAAGSWSIAGAKRFTTRAGTASVLNDGSVLLAGGAQSNDATNFAERFEPACLSQRLSVNSSSISLAGDNGAANLTVTGTPGCRFEVAGLPSWLQTSSVNPFTIPETGSLIVPISTTGSNTSGSSRSVTFTVGNNPVTANQAALSLCTTQAALTPSSFSFNSAATSGVMNVTANASCPWSLNGMPSWFTLSSPNSGTGNAAISYNVAANSGTMRSGAIQLGSQSSSTSYTITQGTSGTCPTNPVMSPAGGMSLPASGGGITVTVSAPATCNWTVTALPNWASFTSASSGIGNGSFSFTAPVNPSTSIRSDWGVLAWTGMTSSFRVEQQVSSGSGCPTPSAQVINSGVTVNGKLIANSCSYGLKGSGYYTDRYVFNATPGNKVSVALSSTSFDTYVYLLDPAGKQIAFNDDGGGGTNSRIPASSGSFTLPVGVAGNYVIQVTSYSTGKTGTYSLTLGVTQ